MSQEFHLSVTPVRSGDYLIRTEQVAQGVPLAEEQVSWPVEDWLSQVRQLMQDPLLGVLQGNAPSPEGAESDTFPADESAASLVALGQQFYSALFQGSIRDSWVMAQGIAHNRGERLRLRLGLKDPCLMRLPWEVLHDGDRPLATGTDLLFSRYQASASFSASTLLSARMERDLDQPIRMLMAIAAPGDQERLELLQEAHNLRTELQQMSLSGTESLVPLPRLELTIIEQPGREQLTQALEQGQYQVFYYAGHSDLGATGGDLYLVSDQTGLTEVLHGHDLAGLLANNGITMAVLNSCRGAHAASEDPEADVASHSLADALNRRGIPAVLAMAERIPDAVALTLSRLFFRNLKQGYPIDLSLSRARQGLISAYGSHQLYWALPVLYLHPAFDGVLVASEGRSPVPDFYPLLVDPLAPLTEENLNPGDFERSDLSEYPGEYPNEYPGLDSAELTNPTDLTPLTDRSDRAEDETPDRPNLDAIDPTTPFVLPDEEPALSLLTPYPWLGEEADTETAVSEEDLAFAADLIRRISNLEEDEEPLLAASGETLLPDTNGSAKDYFKSLAHHLDPTAAESTPGTSEGEDDDQPVSFQQLQTVEMTYRREVELNPTNLEAHANLGLVLYKLERYDESVQIYQRALALDSERPDLYRNLGLALYKQGKTEEAIEAYNQAIQRAQAAAQARPSASVFPLPSLKQLKPYTPLIWACASLVGAVVIAFMAIPGRWLYSQSEPSPSVTAVSPSPTLGDTSDLAQADTGAVTAFAIQEFSDADLETGQKAVTMLLDRQALPQAEAALAAVPNQALDDPAIIFLSGRLAWQSSRKGYGNFSVDDARRYWEFTVSVHPDSTLYQNALGFAYYAEGKLDYANQAWLTSLRLSEAAQTGQTEQGATQPDTSVPSPAPSIKLTPEMLTAYAGLALSFDQAAQKQPSPSQQQPLKQQAMSLYQLIMAESPEAFRPEALRQNWMWPDAAIARWESLGAGQGSSPVATGQ